MFVCTAARGVGASSSAPMLAHMRLYASMLIRVEAQPVLGLVVLDDAADAMRAGGVLDVYVYVCVCVVRVCSVVRVCVRVCRPHARDTCASETKCVFLCVNVRRFECVRCTCERAHSGRGRASMHGPRLAPTRLCTNAVLG